MFYTYTLHTCYLYYTELRETTVQGQGVKAVIQYTKKEKIFSFEENFDSK